MRRCHLTVVLLALAIGGCATVQRGPTETFIVRSTPSGAEVFSTTGWECTTPCAVNPLEVTLEQESPNPVLD